MRTARKPHPVPGPRRHVRVRCTPPWPLGIFAPSAERNRFDAEDSSYRSPNFSNRGLVMSKRNGSLLRCSLRTTALLSRSRIAACALLLISAMLTTSCGLLSQSEGGQNSNNLALSGSFPGGALHQAYSAVLAVSGGSSPYQFVIKSGSLPPGMSLNPVTGSVSGTPTAAGSYVFEVGVTDIPLHDNGSRRFAISVASPGGGIRGTVSPASVNMPSGQTHDFTAAVTGTDNTAVTWAASAGSITNSGRFTA